MLNANAFPYTFPICYCDSLNHIDMNTRLFIAPFITPLNIINTNSKDNKLFDYYKHNWKKRVTKIFGHVLM